MEHAIKKLMESGLTDKEAAVYYAGLVLGPTTVLRLAKKAELKRATVYSVIDALVAKGLMRVDESQLKKVFVAEDPANLQRVIERKMESVGEIIPDLTQLYKKSGKERTIKTYEGLAALEGISDRLMAEAKRGDYRYFIGGSVGWRDVQPKHQEKFFAWLERTQLDVRLLVQESDRSRLHQDHSALLRSEVKVIPKHLNLQSDITITPKLLVLEKLSEPVSAVVIEDPDIIASYKELFLFMWELV